MLENTDLKNVIFKSFKIAGVDFSSCSNFLFEVNYEDCQLDLSNFQQKKMIGTIFYNCSLKEVYFAETIFEKAIFNNFDLKGAIFDFTKLIEADPRTASNYSKSPTNNNIKRAKFSLYGLPGLLEEFGIKIE